MAITMDQITAIAKSAYCKKPKDLTTEQLHLVIGKAVMGEIADNWRKSKKKHEESRRAYYFSAEFLMGRMFYNNLYCMGILDEVKDLLKSKGIDINQFEDIEDAALGNGGLGRLAACFLDSAATQEVPLDGYGIFYRYGLFKQLIKDGYQVEVADNWLKYADPWCIRRVDQAQIVDFADGTVVAVPYDMAIIGYGTKNVNTLRMWQAEPVEEFNFLAFNDGHYDDAVKYKNNCENITRVLYPNDNSYEGKKLRARQQYFFSSASLKDIIRKYKNKFGSDFSHFAEMTTIQLNDTHPVISIPELIRLLQLEGVDFDQAFDIAQKTFNYTNHTVMSEALEKWDTVLLNAIIPDVYAIIERINERQWHDLKYKGVDEYNINAMGIIRDEKVHMARLAMYVSSYVNGVAWIHTEILKNDVLKEWYWVYPERFQNKTNGITQRRWLGLCNPELAAFITDRIGSGWLKDMSKIEKLDSYIDAESVKEFNKIKYTKKKQLAAYIKKMDDVEINPKFIYDIQVKRLHEYKRQLLNAFSIMWIYFRIKSGQLPNFQPTCFIFGAKAAPGYKRAKAIIKYINEIANLVNNDPDTKDKMQVVFVSNYNVSYAEKLVVAADISEQTSTAGTEASGTGNMKFMFNGAVTLGTYDGANVEIAQQAGEENEYIFGGRVEDIERLKKEGYDARALYNSNPMIKRVVDTLIDGTFSDNGAQGEGSFAELHSALIHGTNWHHADHYYLLYDLPDYVATKLKANNAYKDRIAFGTKCLKNVAHCGIFSSDRTILQYATEIWKVK